MSEVKVSAVVGVTEWEGFEFHVLGHFHDRNFGIYDADWLDFHLFYFVAVLAVLTVALYSAFQACSKTWAILFVAFCLLAGTIGPFLIFFLTRSLFPEYLGLDAFLAAEFFGAVISGFIAGTCLGITLKIAKTNMVYFCALLVWEPFGLLIDRFHGGLERVEKSALRVGFAVIWRCGSFCK